MILRLPIPQNAKYLNADEIRQVNEWCARLAQLQLLGAMMEPEVEPVTTQKTGVGLKKTLDPVPTPFAEPPAIKCPQCGNDDIKKFSLVYYAYHLKPVLGFNKDGEIGVGDDGDWNAVSSNDPREDVRRLAGNWLHCFGCQHEMRGTEEMKFDWY